LCNSEFFIVHKINAYRKLSDALNYSLVGVMVAAVRPPQS
jgi:hypothetical protein